MKLNIENYDLWDDNISVNRMDRKILSIKIKQKSRITKLDWNISIFAKIKWRLNGNLSNTCEFVRFIAKYDWIIDRGLSNWNMLISEYVQ